LENYVSRQRFAATRQRLQSGRSIVGLPIARNMIALNRHRALDVTNGTTRPICQVDQPPEQPVNSVKREVEIVVGIETKRIDLSLKTTEGTLEAPNGFLVEVFESGSDGKLKKLIRETVEDPLNDDTLQDGYNSFLRLWTR
jgi:hypothetical protein